MQTGEGIDTSRHHLPLPEWALRMDELTAMGIPYLFILDFELREPVIVRLADVVEAGIRCSLFEAEAKAKAEAEAEAEVEKTDYSCFDYFGYAQHKSAQHKQLTKSPIPFSTYLQGFQKVKSAIQAGDTYLLNLCYSTRLTGITSLEDVYEIARAPYKLLVPERFVLFSPEQFVSIQDDIIRTFPMKGTIDASLPDAAQTLLADIKEQEEHATVVDLLRNDLSIVAKKVTVDRYRYISEIKTHGKSLLQCSSEISGKLRDEYHQRYGSLMHAILPAGSVTGAPKKRTVEIIKDAELEPRGYYTGVFGVFDGETLDSAVMIRMIEQREDGYYYRSGGGITYRSRAEDEFQEMIDKVYVPVS